MGWWVEFSEIIRNLGLIGAAGVGLWLAWVRSAAATRQADASLEQNRLSRGTQRNELFNHAVEQLNHDSLPIRLGGIYTLIGLSNEFDELTYPVVQILEAYLRERPAGFEQSPDREEILGFFAKRIVESSNDA